MPYPIVYEQRWKRQATTPPATPPVTPPASPTPTLPTVPPTSVPTSETTPTSSPTSPTSVTTPTTTPTTPPTSNSTPTTSPTSNGGGDPTSRTQVQTGSSSAYIPPTSTNPTNTGGTTATTEAPVLVTSLSQSVFTTVVTVTDGNGNLITTASVTSSTVSVVTTAKPSSTSKSSNTGAIVGGVVGGIAGLGLLLLLLWCFKRKNKEIKLDENIFDPDRNVQRPGRLHGDVDLADAEARPYAYPVPGNGPRPMSIGSGPEMAQVPVGAYHHGSAPGQVHYGESPYPNVRPSSQYGHMSPGHSDGTGYPTSDGRSSIVSPGSAAGLMVASGAGYPPSSTDRSVTTNSQNPRSAKEREQAARRGMQVANTEDDGNSAVVQHQDGGRLDDVPRREPEPAREVPPAYDSIPHSPEPSGSSGAAAGSRATGDVKRPMS